VATSSKTKKPSSSPALLGTLYIVATPIGNPLDWTERAKDVLTSVEVVAAEDTRVLKREMGKVKITPKKVLSHHEHNEEASTKGLLEVLQSGGDVAIASDAGTPLISDPGFRVVNAAVKAGIKVIPVPGPSSLTAALSASSLGGKTFFFGGFLPTQSEQRKRALQRYKRAAESLVFFEAPHRVREMLADAEGIMGPETPTVVCRELTKPYEEIRHASLGEMKRHFQVNEPRGEFVIIFKSAPGELLAAEDTAIEVVKLIGHGRSASDVLEELQPITELSRKQLYDLILRHKKTV
jgi:16S rRNA (cytidine1402-2'-O)-methyltransferase